LLCYVLVIAQDDIKDSINNKNKIFYQIIEFITSNPFVLKINPSSTQTINVVNYGASTSKARHK